MTPPLSKEAEGEKYARGYITGRINTLRGIADRLREDDELRTLAGLQELLLAWLEDAETQLAKLQEEEK